jgi:hypothetical protein
MKQILISLLLITYITAIELEKNYGDEFHEYNEYSHMRPFWSIEYNTIIIDKINRESDSNVNIGTGIIYKDESKISFSYTNGKQMINNLEKLRYNSYSLFYELSFNTFGRQQGFYAGAGVSHNTYSHIIKNESSSSDTNSSDNNATVIDSQQVDLVLRVGYEHIINDNYILDVSFSGTAASLETDFKRSYYTRFAIKYIFDL